MSRKELLCKAKRQADEWYRLHKPLIEAKQYLERISEQEKERELASANRNDHERLEQIRYQAQS